jgi:acetoin utilization deacetylase AcuC-like enzyme
VTLVYTHPASLGHDTGSHPENAGRMRAIEEALKTAGRSDLEEVDAPQATREQLERAHDAAHLDRIESLCGAGGGMIDLDTVASEGSWEAALRASGAACDAAERLLTGEASAALCALRPPGHHAERGKAMGFCLLNNAAIAAEHARSLGSERVLIYDWDVHHGNGTEEIFKEAPEVLYASVHEWPLYPGTGDIAYRGEGEGEGFTVNLPVPAGSGDEVFCALTEHVVAPIAREFGPDLLVISAGFDAHRDDPLASCTVTERGYRGLASVCSLLAEELEVPLLVCLEGGYDPGALGRSVVATLEGIAGPDATGADSALAAPWRERFADRWALDPSA